MQDFSFVACLEVAEKFVVGWSGVGWGGGLGQFLGSALVKLNNRFNQRTVVTSQFKIKITMLVCS